MSHWQQYLCRRRWLFGVCLWWLLAGCGQTLVQDNIPEYGVVMFNTTMPELPSDTKWIASAPGPFVWGTIQTQPKQSLENWSWQAADSFIEQTEEHNVQVVVTLWPYALWDQASCHGDWPNLITLFGSQFGAPYPPCDAEAYAAWVTAVVQRYGDRVATWQMMRLPENQAAPLANFVGSSQEYARLAQLTTATIQSVQPQAEILSGTIGRPNSTTISFWSPILQNGVKDMFTVLAVSVNDGKEWQSVQTWLERYAWVDPVWVLHTPESQPFAGAAKVFYTISQ